MLENRKNREEEAEPDRCAAALALVFSLTGGAWAAHRYVITSTKRIKPSVLR
jgi:hypothetical protein